MNPIDAEHVMGRQWRSKSRKLSFAIAAFWWLCVALRLSSTPVFGYQMPLRFESLSIEQGLSQSAVYDVVQDRAGFLWVATEDGLNRYDGYRFRIYKHDPKSAQSLSDSFTHALHEDRRGHLWIGTYGGGLNRYVSETDQFQRFPIEAAPLGLSHPSVVNIAEDRTGHLWIATLGGGLNRLNPETGAFSHYRFDADDPQSLVDDAVWTLYFDNGGHLWIGTLNGLCRLSAEQVRDPGHAPRFQRFVHDPADPGSLQGKFVRSICQDRHGHFWIGTYRKGIQKMAPIRDAIGDITTCIFSPFRPGGDELGGLPHQDVRALFRDRKGRLWAGTDGGGLHYYEPKGDRFVGYRKDIADPSSLSSDRVWTIYEDRGGLIWVGTFAGGLNKLNLNHSQFHHLKKETKGDDGLTDNFVKAILGTGPGVLWVGTAVGLNRLTFSPEDELSLHQAQFEHFFHDPQREDSLSHDFVRTLTTDREDSLWVGTWGGGLNRLKAGAQGFERFRADLEPGSISHDHIRSLLVDRDGVLWVGTSGGLNRFIADTNLFEQVDIQADSPEGTERISTIFQSDDGDVWLGTEGGLLRYRPGRGEWRQYVHDPADARSLSNDRVRVILQTEPGQLWLGTNGGGLNRFDMASERFTVFTEAEGLPNNVIYCLVADQRGKLWISTNRGLSEFDPEQANFRNFGAGDGLQSSEFNGGACYQSPTGVLYFGGINGLNAFHPGKLNFRSTPPLVVLTDFQVFGKQVPLNSSFQALEQLTLSYRQHTFSFQFAAMDFSSPGRNQFAYQMEGFDPTWVSLGNNNRTTFTNLNPGDYVFHVKAANNWGTWSNQSKQVRIRITPPWWKTLWARMGGAALMILSLFLMIRIYLARHQRHNAEMLIATQEELQKEFIMAERLREIDRLKDEFLANTSHELRTPLHGIIGLVESLLGDKHASLAGEDRSLLQMVLASAKRLNSLVRDLLDFSTLKNSTIELNRQSVNLFAIVRHVLELSKPLVSHKPLRLINQVPMDLGVLADEDRLQQILHNLVGNAIKFTEQGEVLVSAQGDGQTVTIEVRDSGIGIPEKDWQRIFDSFEQGDSSIRRQFGGTGIGLAISRQLVLLHQGDIWVHSAAGQGAVFTFTLPQTENTVIDITLSEDTQEGAFGRPVSTRPANRKGPTDERANGFSILVVDDEPVNRALLIEHLNECGYRVAAASDGEQALSALDSEDHGFDLVLLDIMMPRMSGYELCRLIRKNQSARQLPVIFLTAKDQPIDMAKAFEAGGNDFLGKPVTRDEILFRVQQHLRILDMHRQLDHAEEVVSASAEATEEAQYASTVLHNIANIVTSVMITCERVQSHLTHSKVEKLQLATDMLFKHRHDLVEFVKDHPKGKYIPDYLHSLSKSISGEIDFLGEEVDEMLRRFDLMKDIIRDQQDQATLESGKNVELDLTEIVVESLRVKKRFIKDAHVRVQSHLHPNLKMSAQRLHAVHILINLIKNGVEAMATTPRDNRMLIIESGLTEQSRTYLTVKDNGVGLSEEARNRCFRMGFTTKDDVHGFGLHYCRKMMANMGGTIEVESAGPHQGASFTLVFPAA